MPNFNWNFLLDNLEDRKCILCVGPDIFNQTGMPRFEQQLADFLRDIFETKRPETQFKAFQKNVPCVAEKPSVVKPLLFNLLGELKKGNSLVLTYNDFYAYLKSVFDEKSIPEKLAENIGDAQHFLFLGLPFDQWYTHLFMNIINTYVDATKEKDQSIQRDAANPFLKKKEIDRASEQHALTFVGKDIADFVNELYERCRKKGYLVGDLDQPSASPASIFDVWRRRMKSGDEEEIADVLENMADHTEGADDDLNTVIHLTGQYNRFLSDKKRGKFATRRAEEAAQNNIVDGILNTITQFEKQS